MTDLHERPHVFKTTDPDTPWTGVRRFGVDGQQFRSHPQALRFALGGPACAPCCPDDCHGCWCSALGACWHHR
jgi:hypothetical protein